MKWIRQCSECGKFVGCKDADAVVYTPYGTCLDIEPPDELAICGACWRGTTDVERKALGRSVWIPPTPYAPQEQEKGCSA